MIGSKKKRIRDECLQMDKIGWVKERWRLGEDEGSEEEDVITPSPHARPLASNKRQTWDFHLSGSDDD